MPGSSWVPGYLFPQTKPTLQMDVFTFYPLVTTDGCKQVHRATEYTEWKWPLSGGHSIMKEKSAQPGEGGGFMPTPFNYIYHPE